MLRNESIRIEDARVAQGCAICDAPFVIGELYYENIIEGALVCQRCKDEQGTD